MTDKCDLLDGLISDKCAEQDGVKMKILINYDIYFANQSLNCNDVALYKV